MTPLALLQPVRASLITAVLLQTLAAIAALLPILALIAFTSAWLGGQDLPGAAVVIAAVVGTSASALAASLATGSARAQDARPIERNDYQLEIFNPGDIPNTEQSLLLLGLGAGVACASRDDTRVRNCFRK